MSADKVYRTELTPVDFLRRSARVFPGKTAVVHGERRFTYAELEARVNRLATALRAPAWRRGSAPPSSRPTRRPCSRPTSPCPPPGACSSPSTPA